MVPEALPPYRPISSVPISATAASDFLTTYIANSESHPHLHPDALITPSGVKFSSHGGRSGGVAMHNLRRVAAGLRGEYLEPEATPEPEEQEEAQDAGTKGKRRNVEVATEVAETANEGWQDLSEFEREQGGTEIGEIGPRDTFVQTGGEPPEVHTTSGAAEEEVGSKRKAKDDKEARKKAKKERNKEFKREKEKKKAKKGE